MRLRGAHARRRTKIERYNKHISRIMKNDEEFLSTFKRLKHKSEHMGFGRGSGKTSPLLIMGIMMCYVHSSKYLGRNWRKRRRITS